METPRPSQEEQIAEKPVAKQAAASVDDLPRRTISVFSGPFGVAFQGYENSRPARKALEDQTQG